MEIIYLDTNIYMDHFDGRVDKLRPLGQFAFEIVRRTLNCEFKIVMSSLIIDELVFNNYKEKITDLIKDLKEKDKIIKIVVNEEHKKETREISRTRKTDFNDTLHAVIANRLKAEYLVTRNVKDFVNLQDLIKIVYPENL